MSRRRAGAGTSARSSDAAGWCRCNGGMATRRDGTAATAGGGSGSRANGSGSGGSRSSRKRSGLPHHTAAFSGTITTTSGAASTSNPGSRRADISSLGLPTCCRSCPTNLLRPTNTNPVSLPLLRLPLHLPLRTSHPLRHHHRRRRAGQRNNRRQIVLQNFGRQGSVQLQQTEDVVRQGDGRRVRERREAGRFARREEGERG
mmetsp:Transcript_24650/g.71068  ORF Transcript_24650/g.71068 Transcript_24650/m.71068 type:complete len:202 (+) Transcript_24650:2549-3154(+)